MPSVSLTPEGEAAWLRFKQHVEWCDSFALIFLFSDHGVVAETFRSRLADIFRARIRGLLLDRPDSPEHLAERLIERLLHPGQGDSSLNAPVWIDLASRRGDDWDKAIREFLARLNERREPLRRVRTRPVILVLPQSDVAMVPAMAPDLWAIRHHTLALGAWEFAAVAGETGTAERSAMPAMPFALTEADERLVQEWERVSGLSDAGSLRAGWRASEVYRRHGRWRDKQRLDSAVLALAREQVRLGETSESLRDLSVSLDNVGRTDVALGQWESARAAYTEGLTIATTLSRKFPDLPDYRKLEVHFAAALTRVREKNAESSC